MSAAVLPLDPQTGARPLGHRQVLIVFSGLMLGMLLAALDQTIVATALPTIVGDLGGLDHLTWVVTAYLLASTASTPLWGKLGDLYGRKRIFQIAIVIFLVGSVLCGLSQTMWHLILFRGMQGLGGGGLIVTAQGLVADIVSPRERGRYQGIFGSVFGLSSIAGPLLGGFFVDHLSWHWVFYVNVPIGALALVVTAATLPSLTRRVEHAVDYLGAALLAAATTCLILTMTLGGTSFPWASPQIVGLGLATMAIVALVIVVERRSPEPILPLTLFRTRTVAVASGIAFIVGFALLGTTTFLPLFMQVVQGVGPTASGLRMAPMMAGVLITSIGSGQIITRWGRYKVFPILGTATMSAGLFLLSRMDENASAVAMSLSMLVFGMGLGMVMQVLIIAVQNTVEYRDLGAATSGVTFARSIGSVIGVALFGAIFNNAMRANLARYLPASALPPGMDPSALEANPAALHQLPAVVHGGLVQAYADSLQTVLVAAIPFALLAFVLSWLLEEAPLRHTAQATDPGDAFAMPKTSSSLDEMARALSVLTSRENRRRMYERIAARAGVDLEPGECWLLLRVEEQSPHALGELARSQHVSATDLRPYVDGLVRRGLLAAPGPDGVDDNVLLVLTSAGQAVVERLLEARRAGLSLLLADWAPETHDELAQLLRHLADSLSREDRPTTPRAA